LKAWYAIGLATLVFLFSGAVPAAPSSTEHAESQDLYKRHCAMCHGQDGRGNTPIGKTFKIPDLLSPAVQKETDSELTEIIHNGKQKMPAFKTGLKPEQVEDLVAYIREWAKPGAATQK
jgi:mono/diheme cytochrome c family protein